PEPDALPMGELALEMPPDCDGIVTVGSGVIGDLGKMLARVSDKALVAVATAPSMDGFASTSASMLVRGVKTSVSTPCPAAILGDTDILSQAPLRMLWAGLGDMLAKPGALCEWRMAHLIVDEPYCPYVADLVRSSLRTILAAADGLAERRPEAIERVAEGLILAGVAMSYAGISRPASGTEHYLSHMWDMQALERHALPDLHGIQVGVATRIALSLFDWSRDQTPDAGRALSARAQAVQTYASDVQAWFGSAAPQILALEARERKNDAQRHAHRLERILLHWPELLTILEEELAPVRDCASLMRRLGMPMTPSDLSITPDNVRNALLGAREIRDKYLWVSLLWDLGLLREATGHVLGMLEAESGRGAR
ncbi:MAG TPA: iron-containing alcohol dehydrogenase, partial [Clostridia bacterium]|nr:iron-containing alcohol dehydrogenase [Clostridia bacterium]